MSQYISSTGHGNRLPRSVWAMWACAVQSAAARRAAMSRILLYLLLCVLAQATIIADQPTLSDRLEKLYEKLEKIAPRPMEPSQDLVKIHENSDKTSPTTERIDKLYEKLDRLNSLTPDKFLSEDDEELLDALTEWGMLEDDKIVKDLQRLKPDNDGEYDDEDLDLGDDDYAMDDGDDLESEDKDGIVEQTLKFETPSALNRLERIDTTLDATITRPLAVDLEQIVTSPVDILAATKARPRVLDDPSAMTSQERASVGRAARAYLTAMVPRSKCQTPQPRWLPVRHMAPASDTLYRPTCVLLHRCAADSGCCHNEEHICGPVEGHYVVIPLYLRKTDGLIAARMQFFNHTRCACVSQDTYQEVRRPPRRNMPERHQARHIQEASAQDNHIQYSRAQDTPTLDGQAQRMEGQEKKLESGANVNQSDWPTQEPKLDSETAAPPQLKRCTCPTLFIARTADNSCACVCDWTDPQRRRDCLSLSRGREHFGLRDRVCVANGDCNSPRCEYGAYEVNYGRCPLKRYRRLRFASRRYLDRSLV